MAYKTEALGIGNPTGFIFYELLTGVCRFDSHPFPSPRP